MAKKRAKTKVAKGEQMPLIDVGPKNLKKIVKVVRDYKFHQKQRQHHLKEEVRLKQEVKELVEKADLHRLKGGNIKFEAEGTIVNIVPQDDLITIKEKTPKRSKAAEKGKKSMKDQVKADEADFEKKTTSKGPQKTVKQSTTSTQKKLKAAEQKEFKKREK